MATRNAMIGTGVALAGLSGLAVAAVSSGAPDAATPLKPTADTVETQTQVVRTVERRTKRLKARRAGDGSTVLEASRSGRSSGRRVSAPGVAAVAAIAPRTSTVRQSGGTDDGATHDAGDDRGGQGEVEAGDDRGGRGSNSGRGGGRRGGRDD